MRSGKNKGILMLWLFCLMVISVTVPGKKLSSPSCAFNARIIASVDEKIDTAMSLAAASSVTSVAISAIPDDTATPLAEQFADFSSYFLVVLCVLFLEKYLLTLIGFASFTFLIPFGLILCILNLRWPDRTLRILAGRLLGLGFLLWLMIPVGVTASDMVYTTYRISVQETLNGAENLSLDLEADANEEAEEQQGLISRVVTTVTSIGSQVLQKARQLIRHFIESLAVMIVTACLIPVIVDVIFLWLIQNLLRLDLVDLTGKGFQMLQNGWERTHKITDKEERNSV